MQPLSGGMDVRSVPADIPPGYFRWKLNARVTPEGKLGRRPGFGRAFSDVLYDDEGVLLTDPNAGSGVNYHNHDFHHVGGTREPITFLQEVTWGDKTRQLFGGSESRLVVLDEENGTWEEIATGKGDYGSYWTAAFLQDVVIFTNDVDNILAYPQGGPIGEIPELRDTVKLKCTAARIAVEFNGVVVLMNTVEDMDDGKGPRRFASRVRWSDLNLPMSWQVTGAPSVAGYQDLDYGDEILAAGFLLGSLYIYTRRKIWRMTVSGVTETMFNFQDVYAEPKNQTGCLAYPRTLVSTGASHFYAARDGFYKYNPFVAAPVRDDWLHRASGVMYTKADTAMTGVTCNAPVGEYRPDTRELWFSWPSGTRTVNNWSLVAQIDFETADVVDHGFTAYCNYRRIPLSALICNETQSFLGASGKDYCIKEIGTTFTRELVTLGTDDEGNENPSVDIAEDANDLYYNVGYYTIIRGMVPTGYFDREKIIKNVLLEDATTEEVDPQDVRLRLGNSYSLADPNDGLTNYGTSVDGVGCRIIWRDAGTNHLSCAEEMTTAEMQAQNIRPSIGKEWPIYEQGRFMYYEFRVQDPYGDPAEGAESFFQRIDFEVLAMPK